MKYATEMKFLNSLILICLSVFCMNAAAQPGIAIESSDKFDFGRYPANEKQFTSFTIANTGNCTLKILNVRKTCGCSAFRLDKDELAAGEKTSLSIAMEAEGIYGPYTKDIYIESNDPRQRFTQISFSGDAVPAFTIKPHDMIYTGRLPPEKDFIQEFIIEKNLPQVFPCTPELNSNIPASAELIPEDGGKYRLRITIKPAAFKGNFRVLIKIPLNAPSSWKPLELIIMGQGPG